MNQNHDDAKMLREVAEIAELESERDALRESLKQIVLAFPITTDLGRAAQTALNMTRSQWGFMHDHTRNALNKRIAELEEQSEHRLRNCISKDTEIDAVKTELSRMRTVVKAAKECVAAWKRDENIEDDETFDAVMEAEERLEGLVDAFTPAVTPPAHLSAWHPYDWSEDAAHENGKYCNTCCECHREFIGHKRRVMCKECWMKTTRVLVEDVVKDMEGFVGMPGFNQICEVWLDKLKTALAPRVEGGVV